MREWQSITSMSDRTWFQSPFAAEIHRGYHHFFTSPKRPHPQEPPTVSNLQIEYPAEFFAWAQKHVDNDGSQIETSDRARKTEGQDNG